MTKNNNSISSRSWPEASQFNKSIRVQFTLYLSVIIIALMSLSGYFVGARYVESVSRNVIKLLLVRARSYAKPAAGLIISERGADVLSLNNLCKKLLSDNQDLFWVGITKRDNVFIAHSDINQVIAGNKIDINPDDRLNELLYEGETIDFRGDTLHLSVPLMENDIRLGDLVLSSSLDQINLARDTAILTVVSVIAMMILIGIPITTLTLYKKLRPLNVITNHLKIIDFQNLSLEIPVANKNETGYLAATLRELGVRLRIAQQEVVKREKIAQELEIAREIQMSILPSEFPVNPHFEFAGIYRSAETVGGDYYDFFDFDDENLAFLVADVSGKSLPGMLVMLMIRDIVKECTRTIRQPAELLKMVNREALLNIKKGMFVTLFYGLINKLTGRVKFASAGHNPLLFLNGSTGESALIKTKGFPIGVFKPTIFDERVENKELLLNKNDCILQYSDGIIEGRNASQQEYGMDRFEQTVKSFHNLSAKELVNMTIEQHKTFVGSASQHDDITLVALKWKKAEFYAAETDRCGISYVHKIQ